MAEELDRILFETAAHRAVRNIRKMPHRGVRDMLDMALSFSGGRFQRAFLRTVQRWLEDEDSAYYALARRAAQTFYEDKLVALGVNIGYNTGTLGAARIRAEEAKTGCNIPWTLELALDADSFRRNREGYHALVTAGEKLGLFTWMLFPGSSMAECLELAAMHPQSSFFLFCSGGKMAWPALDWLCELDNVMPVMELDTHAPTVCGLLQKAGVPYSAYTVYTEEDLPAMADGSRFREMEAVGAIFSVFLPREDCSPKIRRQAFSRITAGRKSQKYATILWELHWDCCLTDRIISGDGIRAGVDRDGRLYCIEPSGKKTWAGSVFPEPEKCLCRAFPKKAKRPAAE